LFSISLWSLFRDFGKVLQGPWLPAQPLLPNENAAYDCQENYAYHQRESIDHGMLVAIANYSHNLWVKAFNRVKTSPYFLDDLFRLFTATKSVFQVAAQRLLNGG
jgi:hypothetical protein